mmetsp:Transcript_1451/g.4195  ORF Transcript_1451/g.4195 Transcript_1451/m.4195 type:complete len:280 (-) Transcript_1451:21-860(-)
MAWTPLGYLTMHEAVSNFSDPSSFSMDLSMWQEPRARISSGSSPARKRDMSRSWTAISAKIPPPPLTYSNGGGDGSREQSLIIMVSPTSPPTTASLTRLKLGSNRLCRPVMSLTPASLQALIASTVSARSVASGFSQNTCLPLTAQALICSAWYWDGEQIQTASTSGSVITSMASPVKRGTPKSEAAFSALDTVGLETMTGRTLGALVMAPRWTMPMRPQPMTPTLISLSAAPEPVMERADRVRKEAADDAEGAKASVEAAHARKRRAEKRIVAARSGR